MKPLVRWTIGAVLEIGVQCLRRSVRLFRSTYGDQFDYAICYNNCDPVTFSDLGVELISQNQYVSMYPYAPTPCGWKFYPPRLRIESHEIFIDNDIVCYRKIPAIERFLAKRDHAMLSEAINIRAYGAFSDIVPASVLHRNNGLIGLPPDYDLYAALVATMLAYPNRSWAEHLDEQGLTVFLLAQLPYELIPLEDVFICLREYRIGRCGMHFGGLNRGVSKYYERCGVLL